MNIVSILNKLKEKHMVSTSEEGISLFSDCFNKFGISILLLNDEEKFSKILELLVENRIPLQKANGIYNLRIFAVEYYEIEDIISSYKQINELTFLRSYPEIITAARDVKIILENMKKYQSNGISYKTGNEYDMKKLLENIEGFSVNNDSINIFLETILEDKSLVNKVKNNIANPGEEDFNIALELQKVENKICEEFLYPADGGWKIIIDDQEINSFQTIKDTIKKIIELNIPVTFHDAFIFVLFYKTQLSVLEVEKILQNGLLEGGK